MLQERSQYIQLYVQKYLVRLVLVHVMPCHQLLHNLQPPMGTSQQEAVQVILQTLGECVQQCVSSPDQL